MAPKDDRFQNQNWLVRLWRFRHCLPIPFVASRIYYREQTREMRDEDDWRMRFVDCWGLATGLAQGSMKWYYTMEEMDLDFKVHGNVEDE